MKTNIALLTTLAVLASAFPSAVQAAPQIYDLKSDWSDTQNPNAPWEYRVYDFYPGDPGDLSDPLGGVDPYFSDELLGNDPYPWVREIVDEGFGIVVERAAITITTEADAVPGFLEVGDIHGLAGWGTSQVKVRWIAPADGLIDIDGAVWDLGALYSAGWELHVNGASASSGASQEASRSEPAEFSNGTGGAEALLNIPVQAGDQVDLRLNSAEGWTTSFGINFTVTFTPDAVDPITAIEDLALAVVAMNLQNGIENSLDSKLDAALNALDDVNANDDAAACNMLQSFINAVEAQRGTKLTVSQADQLIAAAQEIQGSLSCGN